MEQKIHVICWDNVEYNRYASNEEILDLRNKGRIKDDGKILVADFR